jgi:hypothetical protein
MANGKIVGDNVKLGRLVKIGFEPGIILAPVFDEEQYGQDATKQQEELSLLGRFGVTLPAAFVFMASRLSGHEDNNLECQR